MTRQQVILVQKTWKLFRDIDPEVIGDAFYTKLFTSIPAARKLFKSPMTDQYKKVFDMISMVVGRLDKLGEVTDDLKELAKRHVGYGVKITQYDAVGDALLWTLKQGLGRDWTNDIEEAWAACYRTMADVMIEASEHS